MSKKRLEAATAAPVSLEEARRWLKLDHEEDDADITRLILAATSYVERETRTILMRSRWELGISLKRNKVNIPFYPIAEIEKIETMTRAGTRTLLPITGYEVDLDHLPVMVYFLTLPITEKVLNPLRITLKAGYATEADVPETFKQAILRLVTHWYEHRGTLAFDTDVRGKVIEGVSSNIPDDIPHLLRPLKLMRL